MINILIAEDQMANYIFIEDSLREEDFHLVHARNGKEAVEICRKESSIDIVFMDIRMPIMDGFAATERIKDDYPEMPVIAQTAFTTPDIIKKIKNMGFEDYLSKPIDIDDLIFFVKKYSKKY